MSKSISLAIALVTLAGLGQANAEQVVSENQALEQGKDVNGYYPAYPPTTPASGQEELVKRGEYLAQMGDCIAAATDAKSGKGAYVPAAYLLRLLSVLFYSPNITPDKETGIGKWTEQDFIRALKEGRDPQGGNYFPVFPYIYFSKNFR